VTIHAQQKPSKVKSLKITILSTMLADKGIGEWGFSALVEVDGHKILFDTGARPETVMNNASEMKIDLSDVADVFLSHNHQDHTGGLLRLREELTKKNPAALSVAHVGEGIFYPRVAATDSPSRLNPNYMTEVKTKYEATGGKFVVYNKPSQIYPGVWITGPVPRPNNEKNWSGFGKLVQPNGVTVEDNLPEDQSMIFETEDGLVVLSGCGHAGVINTIEYTRKVIRMAPAQTLVGGFHLFGLSDEKIDWTAGKLKEYGLKNFLGAHCTGINPLFAIKAKTGLTRKTAVVAAVGSSFDLATGISPGMIAQ
jgi:7,8-dihydropterin-6-yl-methyl-4-(beta-D-ribofuranosyl)aminobenzene 5'-phosphate synthase